MKFTTDLVNISFRELSKNAIDLWSTKDFDQLRLDFLQTAKTHATGQGLRTEIPFLSRKGDKELTVGQVLAVMDFPQAQRFAAEYFEAIIPHWVEQQKTIAQARKGGVAGYTHSLDGNFLTKALFKLMAKAFSPEQYLEHVVLGQKATWKDDQEKTITTRVKLG